MRRIKRFLKGWIGSRLGQATPSVRTSKRLMFHEDVLDSDPETTENGHLLSKCDDC